ncbi:hypothetical protein ACFL4W_00880 [Planctomycetota bacterium]
MSIKSNICQINRCNQRGGRMLSIIDLIQRETLDLETAAFLASRVHAGASFITGAVPGGAGKTTVMGALLNLLPPETDIIPAEDETGISNLEAQPSRACALVHEISAGHYYCYLWGAPLRRFFALHKQGHILAANLHADDLDQARSQICADNGVPQEDFNAIDLFLFLGVSGGFGARKIIAADIQVYDAASGRHMPLTPAMIFEEAPAGWQKLFRRLLEQQVFTIEEVRKEVLTI